MSGYTLEFVVDVLCLCCKEFITYDVIFVFSVKLFVGVFNFDFILANLSFIYQCTYGL